MADGALQSALDRIGADSVYMFLHYGWANEARANRWHFATRWARHLPTVLIRPETLLSWPVWRNEPRISNCTILDVAANGGMLWSGPSKLQTAQILDAMKQSGHEKPLLWIYNAFFCEAYCALPAIARVHHASDNYHAVSNMSRRYLDRLDLVAQVSDLNVATSAGIARSLRPRATSERVMVATNGCDFASYGVEGAPDAAVAAFRDRFSRIAVFAGNINDRIDFPLMARLADENPACLFLLVGAVMLAGISAAQYRELLQKPNVKSLPAVNPDRLPAIYRAADTGLIPYVQTDAIIENVFPLKALEMAATGLPVVSTLMRPLLPWAPPLAVTETSEGFLAAFGKSRRTPQLSATLRNVAAANNYDARFEAIVRTLADSPRVTGWRPEALPEVSADMGQVEFYVSLDRYRRSFVGAHQGVRYRYFAPAARFVDYLPPGLSKGVRRVKRAILGR